MGYLYKAVCYPDLPTAKQHYTADLFTQWGSGVSLHTAEVISADYDAATFELCRRTDGSACTVAIHPFPTFSECDWDGGTSLFGDMTGWAISFVVLGFCANRLLSILWRPHDPA